MPTQHIIGQIEAIGLPEINDHVMNARIDTGAHTSAIWASKLRKDSEGLHVIFFGEGSEYFTGKEITFSEYSDTVVVNSTGTSQKRYKVKLLVVISGRRVRAWFTLANRSKQAYPILIGRNLLRGKFIVDVSKLNARLK